MTLKPALSEIITVKSATAKILIITKLIMVKITMIKTTTGKKSFLMEMSKILPYINSVIVF